MRLLSDKQLEQLSKYEEQVVFAEAFEPNELVTAPVSDHAVLAELARRCEPVFADGRRTRWRLRDPHRRQALQRIALGSPGRPTQAVHPNGFGMWMAKLLWGERVELDHLTLEDLPPLSTALRFVGEFLPAAESARIAGVIERTSEQRAQAMVLPVGLVGRHMELNRLRDWTLADHNESLRIALVTGIGGSGKSALLAEFISRLTTSDDCATVLLDFDGPHLQSPTTERLTIEFARQLARHFTEYRTELMRFVKCVEDLVGSSEGARNYRQSSRHEQAIAAMWEQECARVRFGTKRVVVVLDTLEEVVIRGEVEIITVGKWVNFLVFMLGVRRLSVLASGRVVPERYFREAYEKAISSLVVGDLPSDDAIELLRRQAPKLSQPVAGELVRRHGGNPLMLRLLGRLLREHDDPLDDEVRRPLAHDFLYDRILKRMRTDDPLVKRLAHPGLVLRRITPALIRDVLARPLGLGEINDDQARKLFDELARQVWLVEPGPKSDIVMHRKDLRRLMLKLMQQDTDLTSTLATVHQAAAQFYADGGSSLDTRAAQIEQAYHEAFIVMPSHTRERAVQLLRSMGEDVDCLPIAHATALRRQAGVDLSEAEMASLPLDDRAHEIDRKRARLELVEPSSKMPDQALAGLYTPSYASHAFATGDWSELRLHGREYLRSHFRSRDSQPAPSLIDSVLWKVAVANALPSVGVDHKSSLVEVLKEINEVAGSSVYALSSSSKLLVQDVIAAVGGLLNGGRYSRFEAEWKWPHTLRSVDELRLWRFLPLSANERRASSNELVVAPFLFRYFERPRMTPSRLDDQVVFWRNRASDVIADEPYLSTFERLGQFDLLPLHACSRGALGRPIMPELYPVCRAALRELPFMVFLEITEKFAQTDRRWPRDLQGASLEKRLHFDVDRTLTVLLELADRFGWVPELLQAAVRYHDEPNLLDFALHVWRRYEKRLNGFSLSAH